jgi:hypothetical protein
VSAADSPESPEASGAAAPGDPPSWALPADAGVPTGGGTDGGGGPAAALSGVMEKLPVDAELLDRKPELLVAGAFAGGFVLARILRRMGGG